MARLERLSRQRVARLALARVHYVVSRAEPCLWIRSGHDEETSGIIRQRRESLAEEGEGFDDCSGRQSGTSIESMRETA